jgi:hypothetical protein
MFYSYPSKIETKKVSSIDVSFFSSVLEEEEKLMDGRLERGGGPA